METSNRGLGISINKFFPIRESVDNVTNNMEESELWKNSMLKYAVIKVDQRIVDVERLTYLEVPSVTMNEVKSAVERKKHR